MGLADYFNAGLEADVMYDWSPDWQAAVDLNREMWCGDHFGVRDGRSFYRLTEIGDRVPCEDTILIDELLSFVRSQQRLRRDVGQVCADWVHFCSRRRQETCLYLPRWTYPICRFGPRFTDCFSGAIGLDVGCMVYPRSLKGAFDSRAQMLSLRADCAETFTPHFRYYRQFGCQIRGIDIQLPLSDSYDQSFGDLRMLESDDATIDFFTIPMILGPGNPSSSALDIALSLCELWRALHPDGLIYIADFVVKPSLVLAASRAGFRVYANNILDEDVPVGLFLAKPHMDWKRSRFRPVMETLQPFELVIPPGQDATIACRYLLSEDPGHPRVVLDHGQTEMARDSVRSQSVN